MNKSLESLLQRAATWPPEAQDEAERALRAIEQKHVEGDLGRVRDRIAQSLSDPRPDVSLDDAFERIELLHAKRVKAGGDVA
jgi:hypothetical protein